MTGSGFIKGMAAGMVMGAAVTLMAESTTSSKKHFTKKAEGVFRNIGSVIDSAMGMRG